MTEPSEAAATVLSDEELLKDALLRGIDLRDYATTIETELKDVERASIDDYLREDENLKNLHTDIRSCDQILEQMQQMLGGFQSDLSEISSEIRGLQTHSMSLNQKLKNRRALEVHLASVVDQMVIPPDLIRRIFEEDVDEKYMEDLANLRLKLTFFAAGVPTESRAYEEMAFEIDIVKSKAISRVRGFLLSSINLLKKPQTNIQVIQAEKLLKYKYILEFLADVAPEIHVEVMESYCSTMDKLYSHHVKSYTAELMKLCADVSGGDDIMASLPDPKREKKRSKASKKANFDPTKTAYSIDGRLFVLQQIEKPSLTTQECKMAASAKEKLAFEVIWRNVNALFVDMATSEYLFCEDYWGRSNKLFGRLFVSSKQFLQDTLRKTLTGSNDGVSMLLIVAINYGLQSVISRKGINALDSYFDLTNINLWPLFKRVFDRHVSSLKTIEVGQMFRSAESPTGPEMSVVTPHEVADKYREFVVSCLRVEMSEMSEQMMAQNLTTLRQEMLGFLNRVAALFTAADGGVGKAAFMVNNSDHILTKFKDSLTATAAGDSATGTPRGEREVDQQNVSFWAKEFEEAAAGLVLLVLTDQFGTLLSLFGENSAAEPDPAAVETLVKDFSATWQPGLAEVCKRVGACFAAEAPLQRSMLKQTFTQLMLCHSRFDECCKKLGLQSKYRKDLVSARDLIDEIKKYSS